VRLDGMLRKPWWNRRLPPGAVAKAATFSLRLQVAERDVGVGETGVEDAAPIAGAAARSAAGFGSALAFDAAGGVGQGVQAGDRDFVPAAFAFAVAAILDPDEGSFDAGQFAAFDFRELAADFVLSSVKGRIDDIAAGLLAQLLEHA